MEKPTRRLAALDMSGRPLKTRIRQLRAVFCFFERSGNTASPRLETAADFGGHSSAHDDVGDHETSARSQNSERFSQYAILIGRQIDDAIRDNDVDGVIGQRR
jgi:hypothetical protein